MLKLSPDKFPVHMWQLDQCPNQLFYMGAAPNTWLGKPRLAVVGSRRPTTYGHAVTKKLTEESARAGVVIISGLAIGIDGLAHKSALEVNGLTVAVMPAGLDKIYPATHQNLAKQIVDQNGTLISEYAAGTTAHKYSFIARNRIIAGLANAVLVTEGGLASGSLHTAGFALELGIPVLAVPGSIYSDNSQGTNQLIRSGAQIVTNIDDIFLALGYRPTPGANSTKSLSNLSLGQEQLLRLIKDSSKTQDELMLASRIDYKKLSSDLTWLEINGLIRPMGNGQWVAF
jgi:DNA processing protein